jgi:hypothetical protein
MRRRGRVLILRCTGGSKFASAPSVTSAMLFFKALARTLRPPLARSTVRQTVRMIEARLRGEESDHRPCQRRRCFLGRRVVRHLRRAGDTIRIASRHPGQTEGDGVEQIVADVQRSVEAAVAGTDGVVNTVACTLSMDARHSGRCTWRGQPKSRRPIAREAGLRPVLMPVPFAAWYTLAGLAEIVPRPPLTRNQVELMQADTTTSDRQDFASSEFRRVRSKKSSTRCSCKAHDDGST